MKSKLFSPDHEIKQQSPLGTKNPDEQIFGNAQDVPTDSCYGDGDREAVPAGIYTYKDK